MIMDGMLSNISQRLHEVNTLLATYGQGVLSFEQVLPPSLFYQDFNDTNLLVKEAACLVKENPGQLLDFSSSLLSETNKFLSLDRTPLQVADFETLFREHLKPLVRGSESKRHKTMERIFGDEQPIGFSASGFGRIQVARRKMQRGKGEVRSSPCASKPVI